jgi:hypothetical protein
MVRKDATGRFTRLALRFAQRHDERCLHFSIIGAKKVRRREWRLLDDYEANARFHHAETVH